MRYLHLTSPHMHGKDVAHLQRAVTRRLKARDIHGVKDDGEYGLDTAHAVALCGFLLGLTDHALAHGATKYVQRRIFRPAIRKPTEYRRARRRLREYRKAHSAGRASDVIDACQRQVGVTEHPHGSNRGADVDRWEADFGFRGAPWCGMFVGYYLRHVGRVAVNARVAYTPSILADASAGTNGFAKRVAHADRQPGDLILFNFSGGSTPQHVGILDDDRAHTIEGNTSGTDPTNGGMVARMERGAGPVCGVARPRWQ